MRTRSKLLLGVLTAVLIVGIGYFITRGADFQLLNPQGHVAQRQFDLMMFTLLLSLVVVVPVFGLTFGIAWRFRASNTKATYRPDWDGSRLAESIWWGLPIILIIILSVVIWTSSHELDPYRALDSNKKPVNVQVVALDWKWLFIYPDENIASVNMLQFPADTPVNFQITSDAPMNSFWIPSLGGQVYAMSGMTTKLHLISNTVGEYKGSSANLSGDGFSGMKFTAKASTDSEYRNWIKSIKKSDVRLDKKTYDALAKQSKNNPVKTYVLEEHELYATIIEKYMGSDHSMKMNGSESDSGSHLAEPSMNEHNGL